MSFGTPSPEERLASIDAFKRVMEHGLSLGHQPSLFPTLVVETDDKFRIAVLDPAPEPEEAFEVAMEWKRAVLEDQESTELHSIGFKSHPGEITLGVFPPDGGTWFVGRINAASGAVEWSPNAKIT